MACSRGAARAWPTSRSSTCGWRRVERWEGCSTHWWHRSSSAPSSSTRWPWWSPRRGSPSVADAVPVDDDGPPARSAAAVGALGRDLIAALTVVAGAGAIILLVRVFGHDWRRAEFVLLVTLLCFPLFALRRRP